MRIIVESNYNVKTNLRVVDLINDISTMSKRRLLLSLFFFETIFEKV